MLLAIATKCWQYLENSINISFLGKLPLAVRSICLWCLYARVRVSTEIWCRCILLSIVSILPCWCLAREYTFKFNAHYHDIYPRANYTNLIWCFRKRYSLLNYWRNYWRNGSEFKINVWPNFVKKTFDIFFEG